MIKKLGKMQCLSTCFHQFAIRSCDWSLCNWKLPRISKNTYRLLCNWKLHAYNIFSFLSWYQSSSRSLNLISFRGIFKCFSYHLVSTSFSSSYYLQAWGWEQLPYLTWLSQFLPFLHNHELLGIIDSTDPSSHQFLVNDKDEKTLNPAYVTWTMKYQ